MNGLLVGNGHSLTVKKSLPTTGPPGGPSLSLPFLPNNHHRGAVCGRPDSDIIAAVWHNSISRLSDSAPFTLLAALGARLLWVRSCCQKTKHPQRPAMYHRRTLDDAAIAALLQQTVQPGLPGQRNSDADLRLSIAGAQKNRTAPACWPLATPAGQHTYHAYFKLPLGLVGGMQADMRSSVENEWLCAQLVAAFGLPVARCDIAHFEAQKVLVVERFDRRLSSDGRWLMRLPQEDLCQTTATPLPQIPSRWRPRHRAHSRYSGRIRK